MSSMALSAVPMSSMTPALVALALLACACGGTKPNEAPPAKTATVAKVPADDPGAAVDDARAKQLAEATRALASVAAEERALVAGAALAEAEAGRLPPELIEAFGSVQNVAPERRSMIAMKAVAAPIMLVALQELCAGKGPETLSRVAEVAPNEKHALVWDGCKLERIGLVTRAEAERSELGQLVLAHLAHLLLGKLGGPTPDELALLRAFVLDTRPG